MNRMHKTTYTHVIYGDCVLNDHFIGNFPHVQKSSQDLTLRLSSATNASGRQYVPLETIINSSSRISLSRQLAEMRQLMRFWHYVKFQGPKVKVNFHAHTP